MDWNAYCSRRFVGPECTDCTKSTNLSQFMPLVARVDGNAYCSRFVDPECTDCTKSTNLSQLIPLVARVDWNAYCSRFVGPECTDYTKSTNLSQFMPLVARVDRNVYCSRFVGLDCTSCIIWHSRFQCNRVALSLQIHWSSIHNYFTGLYHWAQSGTGSCFQFNWITL